MLGYADVNKLGENLQTIMENTEIFKKANMGIYLEAISEMTKYVITFLHRMQYKIII